MYVYVHSNTEHTAVFSATRFSGKLGILSDFCNTLP